MQRGTGILKEFRDFLMRGNVVDLAVAVVIGAAFGAVIAAFVENLLTPLIAAIFGFSGIAGTASNIAWILFVVFLIIALISFLSGRTRVL